MIPSCDHNKAVIEQDIDTEFMEINGFVDAPEDEIEITLSKLFEQAAAHSIGHRDLELRPRFFEPRQDSGQKAESGNRRCSDAEVPARGCPQMRDVVLSPV